jgi:HlyD family secretion protein
MRLAMHRVRTWITWLVVGGAAVAACLHWGPDLYRSAAASLGRSDSKPSIQTYTVKRDTLKIRVIEGGQLRAIREHQIRSERQRGYEAKITWIIPEGTPVKKNDRLIELETENIKKQIQDADDEIKKYAKLLQIEAENRKIKESAGLSDVANAETKLGTARFGLKEYLEYGGPEEMRKREEAVATAQKALDKAEADLRDLAVKADENPSDDPAVVADTEKKILAAREAIRAQQKAVSMSQRNLKIFKAYQYPQTRREKEAAVKNAQLELDKAYSNYKSELNKIDNELNAHRKTMARFEDQLKDFKQALDKSIILAPVDGVVFYDKQMVGYGMELKVGSSIYGGYPVMKIPEFSAFEVDIGIGEEYRGKLQLGCPASISCHAIPALSIEGKLVKIAPVSRPRVQGDDGGPRVYESVVQLKTHDPRMASGMSARVEIVAETVENALLVPVEAVFNEAGATFCFVRAGADWMKRTVRVGRSNDDLVEILEGLREGEVVTLGEPSKQT